MTWNAPSADLVFAGLLVMLLMTVELRFQLAALSYARS